MQRFSKFSSLYGATITAMVSVGAVLIQDALKSSNLNLAPAVNFVIVIVISVIFMQTMGAIATTLIDTWSWLRKLLLGRAYMEGYWVDITFDPDRKLVLFGALSKFGYKNGQMIAASETFNCNGEQLGTFETRSFEYTEDGLKYGYGGFPRSATNKDKQAGYGELQFGVHTRMPSEFSGFYIDTGFRKVLLFEGVKIDDHTLERISSNIEEKREFLRIHIQSFSSRKGYELANAD